VEVETNPHHLAKSHGPGPGKSAFHVRVPNKRSSTGWSTVKVHANNREHAHQIRQDIENKTKF
jgi:hypothetical protein